MHSHITAADNLLNYLLCTINSGNLSKDFITARTFIKSDLTFMSKRRVAFEYVKCSNQSMKI